LIALKQPPVRAARRGASKVARCANSRGDITRCVVPSRHAEQQHAHVQRHPAQRRGQRACNVGQPARLDRRHALGHKKQHAQ